MSKRCAIFTAVMTCLALSACGPIATVNQTVTRKVQQTQKKKAATTTQSTQTIQATQRPQTPAVQVIDCKDVLPPSDSNQLVHSTRNMSCQAASDDIHAPRGGGDPTQGFTTVGGFSCSQISGGQMGGNLRCTNGNRAYQVTWGD